MLDMILKKMMSSFELETGANRLLVSTPNRRCHFSTQVSIRVGQAYTFNPPKILSYKNPVI